MPKVAIVYLAFYADPYLPKFVEAMKAMTYNKDLVELIMVDNPHPVHGSGKESIAREVLPFSGKELPHITLLPQEENLLFAKGNNVGADFALAHGFDYVFFHNQDGFMAPDCISKMVEAMETNKDVALSQAMVLLADKPDTLNSAGNAFHFLGFGYCKDYQTKLADASFNEVFDVPYASGAALMVRASFLKEYGGWDGDLIMYHEDLEWSLRARALGARVACVRDAHFFHAYEFSRSIKKFYLMERNRYAVLLMYYHPLTLLLLSPILCVLDFGLIFFALKGGWFVERMKVYAYWLNPANILFWLKKRSRIQAIKKIGDKDILKISTGSILFQDASTQSPLVTHLANPVMEAYLKVLKLIVRW